MGIVTEPLERSGAAAIGTTGTLGDESAARPLLRAGGVVALASLCSLAIFSAVGGPFGPLNDVGNATVAILGGAAAWTVRRRVPAAATSVAVAGAAVAAAGSALVLSGTTGWFLAGQVSSVGFAGLGAWLVALSRSGVVAGPMNRRLGVAAGLLMAAGIVALPGIPMRLDDATTAPGWIWLGFVGWFGTFVVFPVWTFLATRRGR